MADKYLLTKGIKHAVEDENYKKFVNLIFEFSEGLLISRSKFRDVKFDILGGITPVQFQARRW